MIEILSILLIKRNSNVTNEKQFSATRVYYHIKENLKNATRSFPIFEKLVHGRRF